MKLTDEMYNLAIQKNEMFLAYNDDYVLLNKRMPCTDDELEWYVNSLVDLKNRGVNIASIVDYRLIPGTTSSYSNGTVNYTKGVFLEERAKGKSLDSHSVYLLPKKDYDFNSVVTQYLKMVIEYIEEIELRAQASQEVYDKLVSDCNSVGDLGLMIDPKPLNFFFDKDAGYTIIDVIMGNPKSEEAYFNFLPQYIFGIVFGYGKPSMSIDCDDCSILPKEYSDRLASASEILEAKIVSALRKYGFDDVKIAEAVEKNKFRVSNKYACVEIEDMEDYIASMFNRLKEERESQKKNDDSDSFSLAW